MEEDGLHVSMTMNHEIRQNGEPKTGPTLTNGEPYKQQCTCSDRYYDVE